MTTAKAAFKKIILCFIWLTLQNSALDTLQQKRVLEATMNQLQQELALNPNNQNTLFRQAITATQLGDIDTALENYQKLLTFNPNQLNVLYNIGYTLKMAGRVGEAITYYQDVLSRNPNYEAASFALGHAYLVNGDFDRGWRQHERFLQKEQRNANHLRTFLKEGTLAGKTIVCIPEGGLGDTLHFMRFAKTLHELGAQVIALVQKPLYQLISQCPYLDKVATQAKEVPPFHDKATYMTLPAVFHATEETIPTEPYLFADQTLVDYWQTKIALDTTIKIGLCWQADVANDESRFPVAHRGIPLKKLYPLNALPNCSLYNLQKKDGLEQIAHMPTDFNLIQFDHFDEEHGSFMDSAALIQNLDLVITIDSAIAHLAGGLGKPVWLLLPYATDWRWIAGRNDSPWYPTMRIFKQPYPFDWDTIIQDIMTELVHLTTTL